MYSLSTLYKTWAGLLVKELWYSLDSAAFYVTLGKLFSLSVPLFRCIQTAIFRGQALSLPLIHDSFIKKAQPLATLI